MAPVTVLVAEDDAVNRELVRRLLESILGEGTCRFLEAATGREALRQARAAQPDLLTLDLNLPDLDGGEVLRQLRTDPALATLPVIVISAWPYCEGAELAPAAVLTKPISRSQLRGALQSALGARAAA